MEMDKCLDSRLWQAIAGELVKLPPVDSRIYYFPQGHAEHASNGPIDFTNYPDIPPCVICKVSSVKFMMDSDRDEIYARIGLAPINIINDDNNENFELHNGQEAPLSFAKTLTPSDANNGGGFTVPKHGAEKVFPPLDFSADPPVQTLVMKDLHGTMYSFKHIHRGMPRRHLFTTGWTKFVNDKRLVGGDSVVFVKYDEGDLRVGILRKTGQIGGGGGRLRLGKLKDESIIEAANLAAEGKPFEVVYYPRSGLPEFCVKASVMKAAIQTQWCRGMRFKMAFEAKDSLEKCWVTGTVISVEEIDRNRWPNSMWRILRVRMDEPEKDQTDEYVSPWLVELISDVPTMKLSNLASPKKKLRRSQLNPLLAKKAQNPQSSCNPENSSPKNTPAGMQGARQLSHQFGPFSHSFPLVNYMTKFSNERINHSRPKSTENMSCSVTLATISDASSTSDNLKTPSLKLFGKEIFIKQQIASRSSNCTYSPSRETTNSELNHGRTGAAKHVGDTALSHLAKQTRLPIWTGIKTSAET